MVKQNHRREMQDGAKLLTATRKKMVKGGEGRKGRGEGKGGVKESGDQIHLLKGTSSVTYPLHSGPTS